MNRSCVSTCRAFAHRYGQAEVPESERSKMSVCTTRIATMGVPGTTSASAPASVDAISMAARSIGGDCMVCARDRKATALTSRARCRLAHPL